MLSLHRWYLLCCQSSLILLPVGSYSVSTSGQPIPTCGPLPLLLLKIADSSALQRPALLARSRTQLRQHSATNALSAINLADCVFDELSSQIGSAQSTAGSPFCVQCYAGSYAPGLNLCSSLLLTSLFVSRSRGLVIVRAGGPRLLRADQRRRCTVPMRRGNGSAQQGSRLPCPLRDSRWAKIAGKFELQRLRGRLVHGESRHDRVHAVRNRQVLGNRARHQLHNLP